MTGYELSRNWFDWAFENPDLNTPTHTALYMWFIEKWNRCGQKEKISITTSESMEVLGISSRNTFGKVFKDLCEWNFITIVVDSKNQYSCKVISLAQNLCKQDASIDKALDKALIKQGIKQDASIDTINKQRNKETIEQSNNNIDDENFSFSVLDDSKKEKSSVKKEKDKRPHGEHQNVFLTDEEVNTLLTKYDMEFCHEVVDKLSNFLLNKKPNYYKSHYGAINQWVVEAVKKDRGQRKIQENIITKTSNNGNRETSEQYLKRVGSGLDKIFELRFGKSSNVVADGTTDDSCEFAEFNFA